MVATIEKWERKRAGHEGYIGKIDADRMVATVKNGKENEPATKVIYSQAKTSTMAGSIAQ